jgi:hypothetical protein
LLRREAPEITGVVGPTTGASITDMAVISVETVGTGALASVVVVGSDRSSTTDVEPLTAPA